MIFAPVMYKDIQTSGAKISNIVIVEKKFKN